MFGLLSRSLAARSVAAAVASGKTVRSIAARLYLFIAAIGLVMIGTVSTAVAGPITTVPTSLGPGDEYRLAFVTSTTRDALFTDIGVYNAFVTTVANTQSALTALGTTWMAIASTASVDARDNTGTNSAATGVPIFLLNDTKIADNNADLWDGSLALPLNVTEAGVANISAHVWTGTSTSGTATSYPLGGFTVTVGRSWHSDAKWVNDYQSGNEEYLRPLYGISGVLTVASDTGSGPDQIPEPGTIALFGAGLAIFVLARRSRRRGDCQP